MPCKNRKSSMRSTLAAVLAAGLLTVGLTFSPAHAADDLQYFDHVRLKVEKHGRYMPLKFKLFTKNRRCDGSWRITGQDVDDGGGEVTRAVEKMCQGKLGEIEDKKAWAKLSGGSDVDYACRNATYSVKRGVNTALTLKVYKDKGVLAVDCVGLEPVSG